MIPETYYRTLNKFNYESLMPFIACAIGLFILFSLFTIIMAAIDFNMNKGQKVIEINTNDMTLVSRIEYETSRGTSIVEEYSDGKRVLTVTATPPEGVK